MVSNSISSDFMPEFGSEYDSALKFASDSGIAVEYASELSEVEVMERNY